MSASKYVTKDGESWTFQCPGPVDSPCGTPDGPGFSSSGWPTKEIAAKRGQQHLDEHKDGQLAQDMATFMRDNDLATTPDGKAVLLKDL